MPRGAPLLKRIGTKGGGDRLNPPNPPGETKAGDGTTPYGDTECGTYYGTGGA